MDRRSVHSNCRQEGCFLKSGTSGWTLKLPSQASLASKGCGFWVTGLSSKLCRLLAIYYWANSLTSPPRLGFLSWKGGELVPCRSCKESMQTTWMRAALTESSFTPSVLHLSSTPIVIPIFQNRRLRHGEHNFLKVTPKINAETEIQSPGSSLRASPYRSKQQFGHKIVQLMLCGSCSFLPSSHPNVQVCILVVYYLKNVA